MTVGEMLGGGARLVRTQPRALALWALAYLVVAGAVLALVWPMMGEMAEMQRLAVLAQATGAPPPAPPDGFLGAILFLDLLQLFVLAAIFAAAVRATAGGGSDRFGFLRAGMDEARLVGLALLLGVILLGGTVVFVVVAGLIVGGLYMLAGAGAMIALVPLWIVAFALLVWAHVRVSLAGAFTVLRGRFALREGWRATRGRFWTLFGAYLAILVVYALVSLVMAAILYPELFGFYAALLRGDPDAATLPVRMLAAMTGARLALSVALGTVVNTVLVGWLFGAVATAAIALDGAPTRADAA